MKWLLDSSRRSLKNTLSRLSKWKKKGTEEEAREYDRGRV